MGQQTLFNLIPSNNIDSTTAVAGKADTCDFHMAVVFLMGQQTLFNLIPSKNIDSTRVTWIRPLLWQARLTHVSPMSASSATAVVESTLLDGSFVIW